MLHQRLGNGSIKKQFDEKNNKALSIGSLCSLINFVHQPMDSERSRKPLNTHRLGRQATQKIKWDR